MIGKVNGYTKILSILISDIAKLCLSYKIFLYNLESKHTENKCFWNNYIVMIMNKYRKNKKHQIPQNIGFWNFFYRELYY